MAEPMDANTPNALKQALRALSHQELLNLIFQLSEESSEVLQLLLATVRISPELVKQQPRDFKQVQQLKQEVDNFFAKLYDSLRHEYEDDDYYDREDDDEESPDLESLFETAKICNPEDQLEVFWHIITSGNDRLENEEYALGTEQIQRALGLFAEAVVKLELAPLKKRLYFNSLIAALDWGMCGYGEMTNAIKNALDIICVVPEDYRYLIEQFENNQDELSIDWIAGYYLKLGDEENYLWIRQANLHTEAHYLELADYWLQKGERSRYLATLEQWIAELIQNPSESEFNGGYYSYNSSPNPNTVLYKLADYYRQQQDAENLCRILMTTAEYRKVTLDLYKEIQTISANLGTWQQLQPRLLKSAQRNFQILAEIYLYEQSWDAAIELGDRKDCYENVRIFIAEGIKPYRPENSIKIYEQLVQDYINQKDRKSYRIAARHANDIKAIYLGVLKDAVGWQNYINEIREKYRGYPALKDEFRQL